MANNIFIGNDPLLHGKDYSVQLQELEALSDSIQKRKALLMQMKDNVEQPQAQVSHTPVWDEIDAIVNTMSDKEFEIVTNNDEFKASQDIINSILQAKYLAMMKPMVEQSKEGKDALDNHLTLVKRLKKTASKEVDNEIAEFNEYKEKYANMTYADYLKMKRK